MADDMECPDCGGTEFWRTASSLVTLGEKVKWQCTTCDSGFVRIDGTVDTMAA